MVVDRLVLLERQEPMRLVTSTRGVLIKLCTITYFYTRYGAGLDSKEFFSLWDFLREQNRVQVCVSFVGDCVLLLFTYSIHVQLYLKPAN